MFSPAATGESAVPFGWYQTVVSAEHVPECQSRKMMASASASGRETVVNSSPAAKLVTGRDAPTTATLHRLHLGDARALNWIPDTSVHLSCWPQLV
jgi:hypothetical protein